MRVFLTVSFVLALIACILVFSNEQKAEALPVSYNLTSLSPVFSSYTRANFDALIEAGYNGTVTSIYQARSSNATLNYEVGYHPTLPLSLDTFNNMTANASIAATQSLAITVASGHNNRVLVIGISFQHNADNQHGNARMSSVKIGGNSFTLVLNKTITCGASACDSEIWTMYNPPTGANTITITPVSVTTYHMVAGVYSFYNVRGLAPAGTSAGATSTSVNPAVSLTPTFKGNSWILDNIFSQQAVSPNNPTNTRAWVGHTTVIAGASQYNNNPTIGGSNTLQWTTTNVIWASAGVEIVPIQNQINWGFNMLSTPQNLNMAINGSRFYYPAIYVTATNNAAVNDLDTNTGVETHDFSMTRSGADTCNTAVSTPAIFATATTINGYCGSNLGIEKSTLTTNSSVTAVAANSSPATLSNNKIRYTITGPWYDKFNFNSTSTMGSNGNANACELNHTPTNTTTPIDNIACDLAIPAHVSHFWNGMYLTRNNNYYYNSTLAFLGNTDLQTYKKALTIPASIYGIPDPDVKMVGHWGGADYLVSVSAATIKYASMSSLTTLFNQNRAFQSYDLTLTNTDSHYFLSPSTINPTVSIKLYGPSLNTTISRYALLTLPSGYSMRTTATSESIIRTVDPRWTNTPQNDIPAISTTGSLFPIALTVSNAPTDGGLMLVNSAQVINNINSVWCVTQLDTTHSAECDIPANQCASVYVGDISLSPVIYNYEGSVCATGANAKTIAYTNTLPLTFYTLQYGATHTYNPTTNGLAVTVRSSTAPFTYNVIIKNSTGTIAQNFTATINGTIDTHNFNVTGVTKPASLFVSIPSIGQIYQAYVGSPLSFASTVSFFHQYLSYQGFDLLSFIPLIFASMFTRNTVGIGTALVVVVIATLSFLSVVVVSDTVVIVSMVVAVIGLIGYRGLYG